jgi:peptide/nickel transport system substrate-binding protein
VSDSTNRRSIIYSIYESLVRLDAEGNYQPALAERWVVGQDTRQWTFFLRDGVKFHDGDILDAEDVVATLGRVLDPAIGGAFGTQGVYLSYLEKAEISALGRQRVRITTEEPMADLLDLVVAMPISPKGALGKLPQEHVGSGPYRVAEQTGTSTTLARFDEYWGKAPAYSEIRWVAEPEPAKRVDALASGRADIAANIGKGGAQRLKSTEAGTVFEHDSGLCIIFMLNASRGACQDVRVRQALNYALDVDEIIAEIKGGAAKRLNGYLTPHHFGYNPDTPAYPHDPKKARALLAEAGHGDGLELTFDIPSVMPDEAPRLVELMAKQYAAVGISLKVVEQRDRAAYSEMVREKRIHDAACFDSSPRSTYRVLREKLHSSLRGPWWQGYRNEKVDALIEQAEATFSDPERRKIYQDIYSMVTNDAPWIFLYRPTTYWGVRETLKDWKPRADGLLLLR